MTDRSGVQALPCTCLWSRDQPSHLSAYLQQPVPEASLHCSDGRTSVSVLQLDNEVLQQQICVTNSLIKSSTGPWNDHVHLVCACYVQKFAASDLVHACTALLTEHTVQEVQEDRQAATAFW